MATSLNTSILRAGSLQQWLSAIDGNEVSCTEITQSALETAANPAGEGSSVFIQRYAEEPMKRAEALDRDRRGERAEKGSLRGLPISVKDLFDVAGEITRAGSIVRDDAPPALEDSDAVRLLKQAGAVLVGRTNMTEFAYSGLGINPHYGTPKNPFGRDVGYIPGGSSSGAAVSITDGMALAAIGSDTGGSLRIPAAFCGLVGFKPSQSRMPMKGVFPLSQTLDTIGPIARSVDCCARIDAVLAGEAEGALASVNLGDVRFGVIDGYVTDDMSPEVAHAFDQAISRIKRSGGQLVRVSGKPFQRITEVNQYGGFAAAECYANLKGLLEERESQFDPRVAQRILKGKNISSSNYAEMVAARAELVKEVGALDAEIDILLCPTVPILPPRFADLEDDASYAKANLLVLRNPSVANILDRPSISLPCNTDKPLPVGFMLIGQNLQDRYLLSVARTLEPIIARKD